MIIAATVEPQSADQQAKDAAITAAETQAAAAKAKQKQAVLDRLGITADEAALLLG
jgi:hypothetical protein